jgi:multidrug resistance efflux pump
MKQYLASAVAYLLVVATVAAAQDAKPAQPAQPKAVQIQPAQPGFTRVTAAKMATLEEDFETLEAHRDVKKAIVKAAEVAVKGAENTYERIAKGPNAFPVQEVDKAKFELEMAKAQLEIRAAELKEVEVRVKHAKKRLDEAKAVGVRPQPGIRPVNPKAVDPPPPLVNEDRGLDADVAAALPDADPKAEELKKKVKELEAIVADRKAAAAKAEAVSKEAQAELEKILNVARRGRVRAGTIEAAQAKAQQAKAGAAKAAAEVKKSQDELEQAKAKLKEIEK